MAHRFYRSETQTHPPVKGYLSEASKRHTHLSPHPPPCKPRQERKWTPPSHSHYTILSLFFCSRIFPLAPLFLRSVATDILKFSLIPPLLCHFLFQSPLQGPSPNLVLSRDRPRDLRAQISRIGGDGRERESLQQDKGRPADLLHDYLPHPQFHRLFPPEQAVRTTAGLFSSLLLREIPEAVQFHQPANPWFFVSQVPTPKHNAAPDHPLVASSLRVTLQTTTTSSLPTHHKLRHTRPHEATGPLSVLTTTRCFKARQSASSRRAESDAASRRKPTSIVISAKIRPTAPMANENNPFRFHTRAIGDQATDRRKD